MGSALWRHFSSSLYPCFDPVYNCIQKRAPRVGLLLLVFTGTLPDNARPDSAQHGEKDAAKCESHGVIDRMANPARCKS